MTAFNFGVQLARYRRSVDEARSADPGPDPDDLAAAAERFDHCLGRLLAGLTTSEGRDLAAGLAAGDDVDDPRRSEAP